MMRRPGWGVPQIVGAAFLLLQVALIVHARFVPERYFCWGPYDEQTQYRIRVVIDGRELSRDAVHARYRTAPEGWDARAAANILSKVRRYESTYGSRDHAEVTVHYRRNGHPEAVWHWPATP